MSNKTMNKAELQELIQDLKDRQEELQQLQLNNPDAFTVEELYSKYKSAKESGATETELDAIMQQILEVEYRNNPLVLQRMLILKQLEPYPHKTLDEIMKLYNASLLNANYVKLKINFSEFISKFERENIDIVEFGSSLPLREKIKIIRDKLLEYVKQNDEQGGTPRVDSGLEGPSGGTSAASAE